MKRDIHPPFQEILFVDANNDAKFVVGSPVGGSVAGAVASGKTAEYEGKEYVVCSISTSSASHPAFKKEGEEIPVSSKIAEFKNRYKRNKEARQLQKKHADDHFSALKKKKKR